MSVGTEADVARTLHRIAPRTTWPWLPTAGKGILACHPWCEECGQVQVVGTTRAVPLGGVVNMLGALERRFRQEGVRFTESQKRIVVQRIERAGGADPFGLSQEAQLRIIQRAVSDVMGMSPDVVASHLRSC